MNEFEEQIAEWLLEWLGDQGHETSGEPMENMRGGGAFFDLEYRGRQFTVVVREGM